MTALKRTLSVLDGDDGTLIKVAFASTDRVYVNQHFGASLAFVIYGVSLSDIKLLVISEFHDPASISTEDKLAEKLELLDGCIAVYCRACGSSAIHQLLARGIQPVKVSEDALIDVLLAELQQELREGPSAWLAKAVSRNGLNASRLNDLEAEDWEE